MRVMLKHIHEKCNEISSLGGRDFTSIHIANLNETKNCYAKEKPQSTIL